MSWNRIAFVLAILCLVAVSLSAQTISVQIIEVGRPGADPDPIGEVLVSGAMEEAFSKGLIATSGKPTVDSASKFKGWPMKHADELKQSMVSHVVMILYKKDTFGKPGITYPEQFEFYLWDVEKGELIRGGEIPGMPVSEVLAGGREAVLAYCNETGRSLARECLESLW